MFISGIGRQIGAVRRPLSRFSRWSLALLLVLGTGCSVEDVVADGFYGGISSSISTIVSTMILNQTAL